MDQETQKIINLVQSKAIKNTNDWVENLSERKKEEVELHDKLRDMNFRKNAEDKDVNNDGKVIFGSTVYLENLNTGEKINYKIVGKDEADLKQKLIYFKSPIGKGLIGKNKGDLVEIDTPAGKKNFEIKDVKYI